MDRITGILGNSEITVKPEILFCYLAFAVSVTIFINWTLATLLIMLKPFTCAAILLTFARPDIVQSFMQDENLRQLSDKMNNVFRGFFGILLKLGEQFRTKFR